MVLVGSHDQRSYFNLVKDKMLNAGLEEKVILTGKIDYELMPSIYRKSEMVIFASQTENCPNILLEAMHQINSYFVPISSLCLNC